MRRRSETRCPVQSCPFNRGGQGTVCDYRLFDRPCRHPTYRGAWAAEAELAAAIEANGPAHASLTARAVASNKPLTAERARQLAMALEE